jgi:hypothetical protein
MHSFYSKYTAGDTVCLTVDDIAAFEMEERELGMITAVTFTGVGVLYKVTWSDRSKGNHIEQELTLVVEQGTEAKKPEEED